MALDRINPPSASMIRDWPSRMSWCIAPFCIRHAAAAGTRMHAYIALCLDTGIRTEEARALRWEHVDFGDPAASPPRPASAAVWRSVRSHGDVKTDKSRRTLALPLMAVTALQAHREREPGTAGLVFAARSGEALDTANVRREFGAVCKRAGIGENWTPRELRHSFVSLMSSSGVPVEEIARLAGHSSSRTTEVVYRRELRPVLTTGAQAMDRLFAAPLGSGDAAPIRAASQALNHRGTDPEQPTARCQTVAHVVTGTAGTASGAAAASGGQPFAAVSRRLSANWHSLLSSPVLPGTSAPSRSAHPAPLPPGTGKRPDTGP